MLTGLIKICTLQRVKHPFNPFNLIQVKYRSDAQISISMMTHIAWHIIKMLHFLRENNNYINGKCSLTTCKKCSSTLHAGHQVALYEVPVHSPGGATVDIFSGSRDALMSGIVPQCM